MKPMNPITLQKWTAHFARIRSILVEAMRGKPGITVPCPTSNCDRYGHEIVSEAKNVNSDSESHPVP
jgi:hypothetical protein